MRNKQATRRNLSLLIMTGLILVMIGSRGCRSSQHSHPLRTSIPTATPSVKSLPPNRAYLLVTGYCNCGKCCGWSRSWIRWGTPVYNYGKLKGKPKQIGITATGTRAKHGTIAADPKKFAFGTHLYIPGYGIGTVEDVGDAIKDNHIDIWFPSHEAARQWGARWLVVEIR